MKRMSIVVAAVMIAAAPLVTTTVAHADTCSALFPLTDSWQYQQCEAKMQQQAPPPYTAPSGCPDGFIQVGDNGLGTAICQPKT